MTESSFSQKPGLDQVFMTDQKLLEKIVSIAAVKKSERVLEIGAGTGNLTRLLAKKAKKVLAIEIDRSLEQILDKEFSKSKKVEIVFGNALDILNDKKIDFDVVVSNPPYSISEPLIRMLPGKSFSRAVLTLPWKFVETLTANPEEHRYSRLSLIAQAFFRIETLLNVPADAWSPVPDIRSAVVRLTPRKASGPGEALLREIAMQDDKKLKNALREAMIKSGKGTKRKARGAVEDFGLSPKLLDKKISEMSLNEIRQVLEKISGRY